MAAVLPCCTQRVNARPVPSTGTDATWRRTARGRDLAGDVKDVSGMGECRDAGRGQVGEVKLSSDPVPPLWAVQNLTAGTASWAIQFGARGTVGLALAWEPPSWICLFALGSVEEMRSSSRRPRHYLASWNSERGVCKVAVMTQASSDHGSEG